MKISVIISTYNSPDYLEKVLWAYSIQSFTDFEILIADDGSGDETKERINRLKKDIQTPIYHIWHEDDGFRKTMILNKAIEASNFDYLVFTDGDCIPRKDFLKTHAEYAEKNCFLSGGYHKLSMETSNRITKRSIISQECFNIHWLRSNGMKRSFKNNKISASGLLSLLLNYITPTKPSWNGHNSSGWKKDLLAVNGFDERMQYGGEDRELGERLVNYGLKGKQIRYSAICVHLDHKRAYVNKTAIEKNNAIRHETNREKKTWTAFGINKSNE